MVAFTSIAFAAATLFTLSTSAPADPPLTGEIKRIYAGSTTFNKGLHFEPENLVANIGDVVQVHFQPKNHSFVQSSFEEPCKPLAGGVFSGFNFATNQTEAANVFTFVVKDTKPFWFYCSQTVGEHCQAGMSGVINQNFSGNKTLAVYKANAKKTGVSGSPAEGPVGGAIVPNVPL